MEQMERDVVRKVQELIVLANAHYGTNMRLPDVRYDLRGTCAGQAYAKGWYIRVNKVLCRENYADYIAETVPHEVAHLVARFLWGHRQRSHGPNWQRVMKLFGCAPERCHNYDVTRARVRVVSRVPAYCGCDHVTELTSIRANKIRSGHGSYQCGRCHTRIQLGVKPS